MENKNKVVVVLILLAFVATATVAISKLVSNSGPGDTKQLTQEQRLKALEKLSPQSPTVRRMVAGEQANEEAQKELEQSGK